MTVVYFATNRLTDVNAPFEFSNICAPFDPRYVTFARAEVIGTDLSDESSGTVSAITDRTPANFSANTTAEIVGSKKNLLIFIHGFDNSFQDAIKRAAYNREWFGASGSPAADTVVVAFSWPSAGTLFAAPPHTPPDVYLSDQAQAGRSAFHIAYFLRVIDQLGATYRKANPENKVFLLAHSMGNHALSGAIQLWFTSSDPKGLIFDEAILAAADEVSNALNRPAEGMMTGLNLLAKRISVYYSRCDVAMYLSTTINLTQRLGFDGPVDKSSTTAYPPQAYRMVDCTDIKDYNLLDPPDASHQYYRRSKLVRSDIVSIF